MKGYLSIDIRYDFDLEDDLFEDCETIWDAISVIVDSHEDLSDICTGNKVLNAFYEGFELKDQDDLIEENIEQ